MRAPFLLGFLALILAGCAGPRTIQTHYSWVDVQDMLAWAASSQVMRFEMRGTVPGFTSAQAAERMSRQNWGARVTLEPFDNPLHRPGYRVVVVADVALRARGAEICSGRAIPQQMTPAAAPMVLGAAFCYRERVFSETFGIAPNPDDREAMGRLLRAMARELFPHPSRQKQNRCARTLFVQCID